MRFIMTTYEDGYCHDTHVQVKDGKAVSRKASLTLKEKNTLLRVTLKDLIAAYDFGDELPHDHPVAIAKAALNQIERPTQ